MRRAPLEPSGLVRVTVTSDTRRLDLALPAAVPVAELLPELARCVGQLQTGAVHRGYRLVTQGGRTLAPTSGLRQQGVLDGSLVAVVAGSDEEPLRVYDDVVEAMAEAVESDVVPWSEAARRRAASVAAVVMLLAGAAFLCTQRGSTLAVSAAATVASVLVVGSAAVSRATRAPVMPAVAMLGCVYAAVTGWVAADGVTSVGTLVTRPGVGAMTAGALVCVGLAERRALLLPAVMVGTVLVLVGAVICATPASAASVITAALCLVVIAGSIYPRWALHVAGGPSAPTFLDGACPEPLSAVDLERLRADARLGHEILAAFSASAGAVLAMGAPWAVSLGVAGTLVPVLASIILMLRTCQYRAGTEVLVGLCSGGLGLVSTAVAVLCMHPGWRPVTALALQVTGVGLLVLSHPRAGTSMWRGRVVEMLESVAILALPATLVVASGQIRVPWR